jgi:tetratricopeptide (TPR) repeat protein
MAGGGRSGIRWTALAMAFCAVARAGSVSGQGVWDDPAFALYRQAVDAIDRKDYERATRLAREALSQYSDHVLAHYLLGQAALARSAWEEAVAAFTTVARLYPASFAAQRDLGIALDELGRVDEARAAFETALARRADSSDVRTRLAFMLLRAGQKDRAVAHLEALAAQGSSTPEVWIALARVRYEHGELAGSEKAFARAVALRDDGRAWFNLGVVRARLDDRPGALEAFEHAAQHPDVRAQATREIGRLREAPARGQKR